MIRKATHDYDGWYRADSLWMYLAPPACRKLGLFLLAAAGFHGPKTDTALELEHPESDIRRIVVRGSELRLDVTRAIV